MPSRKVKYKCGCEYMQHLEDKFAYLMDRLEKDAATIECEKCKQDRVLSEELRNKIKEDPYYYVYEGGSDGTFGHQEYLDELGELASVASKYAANLLEKQGKDW